MSLVSQQQLQQNQSKLQQLEEQSRKQTAQTKSFTSERTATTTTSTVHPRMTPMNSANPLVITLPTQANPTDILAARFNAWRNVISALSHYLKEIVSVNEETTRQQIRLHHAITFPFLTQGLDGDFYQPLRVASSAQNQNRNSTNPLTGQLFHSNKEANSNDTVDFDISKQNNEFDIARKMFMPLGSGSVQDLPTILYQYHSTAALLAQTTVKELNNGVVPRLEDLKRDLLVKIKEIKSLQSDFKNNVERFQHETQSALANYIKAIEMSQNSPSQLDPKNDPYLLKTILDRSIRRQLTEENYLHEAFNNIQNSGCELEKVVYIELQSALTIYAKLIGQQAQNVFDGLLAKLDSTILTKDPSIEWDNFISNDPKNFISQALPMRRVSEIKYNYQTNPLTIEFRSGYLERKSKYLKSYAKGYYVLTPSFLHEFKTSDRKKDPIPVMSLPVSELKVTEHSRRDEENPGGYHKFVIQSGSGGSGGLLGRGHKWVFRVDGYPSMMNWYGDIKKLASLPNPVSRSQVCGDRKMQKRIISGANTTNASITREGSLMESSISRQRGISNVTDRTERSTINESSLTTSPQTSHMPPAKSNPGKFSLDPSMVEPVITVPVSVNTVLPADKKEVSILDRDSHPSYLADSTAAGEGDIISEQSQIKQEQALLEQQQRELINKQRDLQQRAMSLSSRTLSLNSTTNSSAHQVGSSSLNPLRETKLNQEHDFEKVGELNA